MTLKTQRECAGPLRQRERGSNVPLFAGTINGRYSPGRILAADVGHVIWADHAMKTVRAGGNA
jgi:hypothetical protein